MLVTIRGQAVSLHSVNVNDRVLVVDVETAWRELGLESSAEVQVKAIIKPLFTED